MFRLRRMRIDTLVEHVVFIAERAVAEGQLGFKPLDRVLVMGRAAGGPAEVVVPAHDERVQL
jgi:hypothetical protein